MAPLTFGKLRENFLDYQVSHRSEYYSRSQKVEESRGGALLSKNVGRLRPPLSYEPGPILPWKLRRLSELDRIPWLLNSEFFLDLLMCLQRNEVVLVRALTT